MTNTVQNPGGRLTLSINTTDITITNDGGVIAHRPCSVFPCQKNRAGDDSSDYVADATSLDTGEAAVSFRPYVAADNDERYRVFGTPGRSRHAESMAVVCVPWPKQSIPVFRPPAIGRPNNPIVSWFRRYPIPIAKMAMERLPKLDLLPPGKATEVGRRILQRMARFSGDIWSGWSTDTRTPDLQHAGYGRDYAGDVSQALTVILDQGIDLEVRKALTIALVQRGIDMIGAFGDYRRNWMVDGGHMWGRWPLVVFAGYMLNIPECFYPSPLQQADLVEFRAFYEARNAWWHGSSSGWVRGWNEPRFLDKHPSQWTTSERGERWAFNGYYPHVMGANLGLARALQHLGLTMSLSPAMFFCINEWCAKLKYDTALALSNNGCQGVVDAWGTSFAAFGDSQLCAEAWSRIKS